MLLDLRSEDLRFKFINVPSHWKNQSESQKEDDSDETKLVVIIRSSTSFSWANPISVLRNIEAMSLFLVLCQC